MSSSRRVALVTGGNKGIGFAICRALAKDNNPAIQVLLGSRDEQRGQEAKQKLKREGLDVDTIALDIDDKTSIDTAAKKIEAEYGGLDILINNAGMAFKGDEFNENVCRKTIDTNYYGTKHVYERFKSLLRDGARVVNISSMAGRSALRNMSAENRQRFLKDDLSINELDKLMEEFIHDVKTGDYEAKGWPRSGYGMSKAAVSMMTRIHARDNRQPGVLINCCCPGWVKTDMAGDRAPKTPDQGAETPVMLALLPEGEKTTGKFWEDKQVKDYV